MTFSARFTGSQIPLLFLWLGVLLGCGGAAYAATGTSPPVDVPITISSSSSGTVAAVTLTNGPPNLSAGMIPAGMPSGSPVSDVYADNSNNSAFSGTFSPPTGANAASFSISTATNCGSAGNITCGKLVTVGVIAAGTYNITLTTSQGGSQAVTINAVSGTAVGCPGGASDATVTNAANAAGVGATLLFGNCSYSWSNGVKALNNQKWVGIPGQTVFDAHGNGINSGACGDLIMICGFNAGTTGVTIANITFQNLATNLVNPVGCQPGGGALPDCPYRYYMMSTHDGWNVQNNRFQNSTFGGIASQGNLGSGGTVNLINNVMANAGGFGGNDTAMPDTLNVIGNDQTGNNPALQNPCNGAGNKTLANNYTMNMKFNYFHHNPAPAFWEDSYSNQHYHITGNTFVTSSDGGGASAALMFENNAAASGDIGFNVFVDNGNSASTPTGNDPICGGEGSPGEAIVIQAAQNFTIHDNNVASHLGPSTAQGQWAGGTILFGDEGAPQVPTQNITIQNNSITFGGTAPGGRQQSFGAGWGGNLATSNITASGDSFHYAYSGASASDPHFFWMPYNGPLLSLSQLQSNAGQEIGSTIDFTDKTANGCLHVACAVNPVGAGGVPTSSAGAGQTIASVNLSNSTFTAATANAAVGTVSATMSPSSPAFSGSFSLTGANSGGFHLVGTALQASASGTAAGTYSDLNIIATQSGVSNSPQQITPSLVGSSGGGPNTAAVTVQSGAVQTFGGVGMTPMGCCGENYFGSPPAVRSNVLTRLFGPGKFNAVRPWVDEQAAELEMAAAGMTAMMIHAEFCGAIGTDAATWADEALNFVNAGVPVKAVDISNKPNADFQTHCGIIPASTTASDIAALRSALDARGLSSVLVAGPSTVEWAPISAHELTIYGLSPGDTVNYQSAIVNNSSALSALGAYSTQSYGSGITTTMQTWAQQNSKPYWVALSNRPYIETGPGPIGRDAAGTATLLSDINHGAVYWFTWTWNDIWNSGDVPQTIGAIVMRPYYFSLTNMTSVFDPGAVVRQSTVMPAAPTTDMHYNVGSEPQVTVAAAKNPGGQWGIGLVNLTGFHGAQINDGFYTASEAKTITVTITIQELSSTPSLVFHQHITNEGDTAITTGADITAVNGVLTVPLSSLQTVSLRSN